MWGWMVIDSYELQPDRDASVELAKRLLVDSI